MWSNNTGDAKIEDPTQVWVKILNGLEKIDTNIFLKIATCKITRGHDFTVVKGQSRADVQLLLG